MRAAICHASPIVLNSFRTTQKAINLLHRAAGNSANLVVFPETYIPAFPVWSALQTPHQNHDFFHRMTRESIYADGEEIRAIRNAAKQLNILVSLGFSERARHSTGTLYNSNVIIGTSGQVLVHHRKLMPTFFEKLTWSPGDGYGLRVADTEFGAIGALICGENTNPLARYSLMTQSEQIHISTWPAIWPTRVQEEATQTSEVGAEPVAKAANYDNVAANRIRGAAHCFEAKCFGILSAGLLDDAAKHDLAAASSDPSKIRKQLDAAPQAPSLFLDPTGASLPGFTIDPQTNTRQQHEFLRDKEDILYADIDTDKCIEGKQYHDVTGGYQRLDIFELKVDRTRREPAVFID